MFGWLKRSSPTVPELHTDIHSHLLPGLDDGVKTLEQTEEIVRQFSRLGYNKLITTPHVNQDLFRNTHDGILEALARTNEYLHAQRISVDLTAAAEYYLDESFLKVLESGEPILTFGDNFLLFETNFLSEPLNLNEFIFAATTRGLKPVLAHPERYVYLHNNFTKIEDLMDRGVLLQININSLSGIYGRNIQQMAGAMIDRGFVHLLGSDCHNLNHINQLQKGRQSRAYKKALQLNLLNNKL